MKSLNKFLALILSKIIRIFPSRKKIWIIGASRGEKFTDNGAVLFEYVLKNFPEIDIRWIINKDCPEYSKAKNAGPTLARGSLKGNLYTLLADVLICTHSLPRDVSTYNIERYESATKVFISHGIEGFKRKIKRHAETHKIYDLSVAVSDFEKNIKVKKWGLDEEKICISGLPRYDKLTEHRNKKGEIKNIFYMPTWCPRYRKKIDKPFSRMTKKDIEKFKKGKYYRSVSGFISNTDLLKLLKENNLNLNVFFHQSIHSFMKEIIEASALSNVNIIPYDSDIQKNIIESDLLVTDYSSVCWDFLYLDRPVIFYQFDQKEHLEKIGCYLDIPDDLFGPVTRTPEETIKSMTAIIKGEKSYKQLREKSVDKFFKFQDDNNCKRITRCIIKADKK